MEHLASYFRTRPTNEILSNVGLSLSDIAK